MNLRQLKSLAAALALGLAATPVARAQAIGTAPAVVADAAAIRMQTFQTVWQTVNDKFFDPSFNGVDWTAVREKYRPRVAGLATDAALYPLLGEMLGELHASHFGLIPPEEATPANEPVDAANDPSYGGEAGMIVRMVAGAPTITAVAAGGPADTAGLKPGFVVTRIGSHDLAKALARIEARSERGQMRAFLVRRAAESFLGGMPGSKVEVAYLDAQNQPKVASITRRPAEGKPLKFGEMPTVLGRVDVRRLEGGVGYVGFNIWLPQLLDEIRTAVRSFKGAPGVVIDLRGNPGGMGMMAPALASLFDVKQSTLGTMKMRSGEIRFVSFPQNDAYDGPVAILTDEGSASTSEVFAGGMQENGRAIVVGETTLGAVLPSLIERLPNGAIFQYAVADFKTPKGVLLEGRGVVPNVVVTPTRAEYLTGRDLALDAAVRSIRTAGSPKQ